MNPLTLRLGGAKWIDGAYNNDGDIGILCAEFAASLEDCESKVRSFSIEIERGWSSCLYAKSFDYNNHPTVLITLYSIRSEGDVPYSKKIFDEAKQRVDKRRYSDTLRHHFRFNEYLGYH